MSVLKLESKKYYDDARKSFDSKGVNVFALPKIQKISINVGVGDYKNDTKVRTNIENYLYQLTGQKPKVIESRLSIAGFKLRKGEPVGMLVTLRGKVMYDFLLSLVYLSLPRARDFRGINDASFDKTFKSYSLGIDNASIFPTIGFDASVNFGIQLNIVFDKGSEKNIELLKKLNFPFKKK